jgi:hypothetical protein
LKKQRFWRCTATRTSEKTHSEYYAEPDSDSARFRFLWEKIKRARHGTHPSRKCRPNEVDSWPQENSGPSRMSLCGRMPFSANLPHMEWALVLPPANCVVALCVFDHLVQSQSFLGKPWNKIIDASAYFLSRKFEGYPLPDASRLGKLLLLCAFSSKKQNSPRERFPYSAKGSHRKKEQGRSGEGSGVLMKNKSTYDKKS